MININVLDTDFNIVTVIDTYESFIWTDRFREPGDFELYSGIDLCVLSYILNFPFCNFFHFIALMIQNFYVLNVSKTTKNTIYK